ncbi:uncharacterized protein LOC135199252 isoform X2 [Macrobrachium nipponense]|uniref:uncharacterized protein LOC135199252 isoform X2 n=1 Tax=Macrobrachium nipponense TaxID=159736 RepID=UPI0030C7EFE7
MKKSLANASVLLLPLWMLLFLVSRATAVQYVDISDPDNHPMIKAAEESTVTCPTNIDPNAYWMKRFLELIKDRMPHQAVTWDDLLPNLRHLVDLETKGYLAAIAKGDYKADAIQWPNEALKPWIIPTFMPVITPPDPEPVIVLEQVYNGETMFKEIVGNQVRKKRDLNGGEVDEVEALPQRAFRVHPNHFNDDLPYLGDKPDYDIHEPEFDEDGQVIGRKKRNTPPNMVVWPPPGTLFTVKRLCVKASDNGTIEFP